jgi:hypothetical protein
MAERCTTKSNTEYVRGDQRTEASTVGAAKSAEAPDLKFWSSSRFDVPLVAAVASQVTRPGTAFPYCRTSIVTTCVILREANFPTVRGASR